MTSYRAELAGIQEVIRVLKHANLQGKTIEMGCDNKGAIDKTTSQYISLDDMTAAEGDLIKVITETLPEFPNITLTHVRGHQDRGISYENLPLEAQLNVDCDNKARRAMREQMIPTTRPDPIEGVGVTLYISGNMINQ